MKAILIAVLIKAMSFWVPVPKQFDGEKTEAYYKRLGETTADIEARRSKIANAIFTVAFDPAEKPVFGGPKGRIMTVQFMNSIASFESSYHRLVFAGKWNGDCKILQNDGTYRACTVPESEKHGRSVCFMQVNVGEGKTVEGWSRKDLLEDPEKCARAALHILRESVKVCTSAPHNFTWEKDGPDIFSAYMSTGCFRGNIAAKNRWDRAKAWFDKNPFDYSDSDFLPDAVKPKI